ncbi:MAG: hypothetical protein RLN60_05040 [Phycisphaerales bacterium]
MGVTAKLLKLYRVDQQLDGLKSRLRAAEAYLKNQESQLADLEAKSKALNDNVKKIEASVHNDETEMKSIDERVETLRDRMNNARTSKEHSAYLTEINTLKADKGLIEERSIEMLTGLDELKEQAAQLKAQKTEREGIRKVAKSDRDERAKEIESKLDELETERQTVKADVPESALAIYEARLEFGIEDVMAPVSEESRRHAEYTCGSCFTLLPMENVNTILKKDALTTCPACDAILYMEDSLHEEISTAIEKKRSKAAT